MPSSLAKQPDDPRHAEISFWLYSGGGPGGMPQVPRELSRSPVRPFARSPVRAKPEKVRTCPVDQECCLAVYGSLISAGRSRWNRETATLALLSFAMLIVSLDQ
ncbi:hypothetical protein AB0D04_38320, partial [Streptomyces sp. NPDC048483]|uniref:hypothetical protein n=1 Tax=Streptomyces sp. NPDC048483 TaxID=3154927 RepID=UPI00343F77BD